MKEKKALDHEARGLRVRLEEEKEKHETKGKAKMKSLTDKVEVLSTLLKNYAGKNSKAKALKADDDSAPPKPPVAAGKPSSEEEARLAKDEKAVAGEDKKVRPPAAVALGSAQCGIMRRRAARTVGSRI